jgi:hypothetical protein
MAKKFNLFIFMGFFYVENIGSVKVATFFALFYLKPVPFALVWKYNV